MMGQRMKPAEVLWSAAPGGLKPAVGKVHVFSVPLDVPAQRLQDLAHWLSDDEWQRARRFLLDRDRRRFLAGRGMLREILGALLDVHPANLVFAYGEFGKPRIAAPAGAHSLHFNMAHSDSLAVCATASHELGVDLERVRAMDEAEQIASRFFSTREAERLAALPAEQRLEAFFNCWTRKEAYLKAIGRGLDDGLDRIEVSLAPGEAAELLGLPDDRRPWRLQALAPAKEFVGAVAIQQEDSSVNCWTWGGWR
jgi:4'-phosphopantetheinyl transferase